MSGDVEGMGGGAMSCAGNGIPTHEDGMAAPGAVCMTGGMTGGMVGGMVGGMG